MRPSTTKIIISWGLWIQIVAILFKCIGIVEFSWLWVLAPTLAYIFIILLFLSINLIIDFFLFGDE